MEKIRKAKWAGQFYTSDPVELRSQIEQFLVLAQPKEIDRNIFGIIAPHAGYVYSGPTAACGYAYLDKKYDNVFVIAPSHAEFFQGVSVYNGDVYETPLGKLDVNKQLAKKIARAENINLADHGHANKGGRDEHSLEVQLPFLQVVLGEFKVVPIVFHEYTIENCEGLAKVIANCCQPNNTLVVASTDLYHGYSYEECARMDDLTIDVIKNGDAKEFLEGNKTGTYQACGAGPVAVLMALQKIWDNSTLELVARTNSSDITGIKGDWTVGYASFVAYQKN